MTRALLLAAILLPGARSAAADLNGCNIATAMDLRGTGNVGVNVGINNTYSPACVLIDAGQTVVFTSNFAAHPLRGGTVVNTVPTPDPNSPVPAVSSGNGSVNVTFNTAGGYGYYCEAHVDFGMYGAIFVNDAGLIFRDDFE